MGCGFARLVSKSVPQRLKPSIGRPFTARLNPCPSLRAFRPGIHTSGKRITEKHGHLSLLVIASRSKPGGI